MIDSYHRPSSLDEALHLVASDDAAVLGGGTSLIPTTMARSVVDLQGLGLDGIALDGAEIDVGSMTRLRDLVESDLIPHELRDLAKREAPNTLRNAATAGGTVAGADPESELLAGLLVYRSTVNVVDPTGRTTLPLSEYLDTRPAGIITEIRLQTGGRAATTRTGRTPADRPIVAAVARRDDEGTIVLALTGVASTPIVVDPNAVSSLDPPSDFRGSTEYRRHLAETLSRRAVAELDA